MFNPAGLKTLYQLRLSIRTISLYSVFSSRVVQTVKSCKCQARNSRTVFIYPVILPDKQLNMTEFFLYMHFVSAGLCQGGVYVWIHFAFDTLWSCHISIMYNNNSPDQSRPNNVTSLLQIWNINSWQNVLRQFYCRSHCSTALLRPFEVNMKN